jgi:class 3 adenylate cyclase
MLQGPNVPTERVERRLAAIFCRGCGYSRLMELMRAALFAAQGHRRTLVDPKIAQHRGRIVKTTGDECWWSSRASWMRCDAPSRSSAGWPAQCERTEDQRIEFRIGINVGDIVTEGGDIFGDGVNVAARLETLADPGGICVSGRVIVIAAPGSLPMYRPARSKKEKRWSRTAAARRCRAAFATGQRCTGSARSRP